MTSVAPPFVPKIRLYQQWLGDTHGLHFGSYADLWQWSVTETDAFWQSLWEHEGMQSPTPHTVALADAHMPGAQWFPGAQVNYAQRVFRHVQAADAAGQPAIISDNENGQARTLTWPELQRQVASMALTLQGMGVQRGDRVGAYLPNVPETVVAFLACASIGAIWSVCAPDMGTQAVTDRLKQIEPKVLIAVDGVHYAGKAMDRSTVVDELRQALPTVQQVIVLQSPYATGAAQADLTFAQAVARDDDATRSFTPVWLPFDQPLWVVYSSGTTGLPKPLVHSHGGVIMLTASGGLHHDFGPSYHPNSFGERFHWYSSTGWIMWNMQVGGLLGGTTICLFDGSPSGPKVHADWGLLWRFAAKHRVTWFGAGAAYYAGCLKAEVDLSQCGELGQIRALGSTGSPLSEDAQNWGTAQFDKLGVPGIWWNNLSGGTDFCGVFIGGHRELPLVPGGLQCRHLGCAVEAWDENGKAVIDQVGELVCTKPLPSMPLYFWGDTGNARYLSSYFDVFPGVWRHGDWLKVNPDGSCVIYGRSDATINRHGLRMGTSEIYSAVEALPEVLDSMVIDLEYLGRESRMVLFVSLKPGHDMCDELNKRIQGAIRTSLSPRFVPDVLLQAPEIPRTLSGKKQEVPIKKLFLGQPLDKVVNRDAMANAHCLPWYAEQAKVHGTGAQA
jgi:acetoacetyl-CoA synthetase